MSEESNPRIKKSNSNQKKNLKIEYIRAIAAIGVVSIHTIYSGILYSGDVTTPYVVLFFTMIKNMLYWAVPCFGMISGMLLLNPEKEISLKKIYGKYLVRIAIVLLLFGTAFSWIEVIFNEHNISLKQIPEAVLMVLKHQTWEHLWYLYALLTIYLLLPLWGYIVKKCNSIALIGIIAVLYILSFVLNSREISLHLFFMMGELFRRQFIKLDKKRSLIVVCVSSVLILITVYIHEVVKVDLNRLLGYTSVFVAVQAFSFFTFLYGLNFDGLNERLRKILLRISEYSFGIYIVHMFFVNLEYKVINLHLMNSLVSVVIFAVLITVNVLLSYFATAVMKMIPGIKKLI